MSEPEPLDLLRRAQITVKGRLPWSSNVTLLVELTHGRATALAVYKPGRGERRLWDFPPGLYRRELAAYELSEALGWRLIPPTIVRDGPLGEGSIQLFVSADFAQHYLTLVERPEHRERLQQLCAFDLLANNADRKSGHCLLGPDAQIHAIDNGLTFHHEWKLRTVIWEFANEPIPDDMLVAIRRLASGGLPPAVAELLEPAEQEALLARGQGLLDEPRFPAASSSARYPWPLV